jgi:hypothetical protein
MIKRAIHRKTELLLAAFVLGASFSAKAQDDYVQAPVTHGIWGSAYMMSGSSGMDGRDLLIGDARVLANGSLLLPPTLAGYDQAWSWWVVPATGVFNTSVGIHPFRGERSKGPELRLGIQFAGGEVGRLEYERTLRYPMDTLVSPTTGAVYFVDSLFRSRLSIGHSANRFGLESSLIFRTGGKSRWSLFGGAGLGFGVRYNVETAVVLREEGYLDFPGAPVQVDREVERAEVFENSGGAWLSLCAPFGVSFQMAKRGNFLRWVDLFLEFRPGMLIYATSEFGTISRTGSQSLFGLRVRIGR